MTDGPTPSPTSAPAPEATAPATTAPASPAAARTFTPARLVFALAAVAALAALLWPQGPSGRKVPTGSFLVDAAGHPVPLGRELGRPVTLVHFWASWCAPCVTEIPSLIAYGKEAANDRLGLVLVAVEEEPEKARRFLGEVPFPVLYDPSWDVAHRFGTRQLPETHVVADGRIVYSFIGAADWSDPKVRSRVAAALRP